MTDTIYRGQQRSNPMMNWCGKHNLLHQGKTCRRCEADTHPYAEGTAARHRHDLIVREAVIAHLEAAHATLIRHLREKVQAWRETAQWECDEMGNSQAGQSFDQCADELAALLPALEPER
jgi:predicted ATPase